MSTVEAELVPNPNGMNADGVITVAAALDYDPAEFDPLVELYGLWTPSSPTGTCRFRECPRRSTSAWTGS